MERRKFYVTPTHIVDPDVIGQVKYYPVGSATGGYTIDENYKQIAEVRKTSELFISFKDPDIYPSIKLSGDAADQAWQNFQWACGADTTHLQIKAIREEEDARKKAVNQS